MANRKLKVELELDTARAKAQAKSLAETAGGGSASSGGASRLASSLDKAAKSAEKTASSFDGMNGKAAQLTRGFAGIAVGMATSYASNYGEELRRQAADSNAEKAEMGRRGGEDDASSSEAVRRPLPLLASTSASPRLSNLRVKKQGPFENKVQKIQSALDSLTKVGGYFYGTGPKAEAEATPATASRSRVPSFSGFSVAATPTQDISFGDAAPATDVADEAAQNVREDQLSTLRDILEELKKQEGTTWQ
jgi:hypothetical protein